MSLIRFSKIGKNNIIFSGLSNDEDYLQFNKSYTVEDPKSLFSFVGSDYSNFLSELKVGDVIDFLTFKSGEKIQFECISNITEEYGATTLYCHYVMLRLYYVDKNGNKSILVTGQFQVGWGKSKESVTNENVFFSAAVDNEQKLGYLTIIYNSLSNGTGSYENRKPGTHITEFSADSNSTKQIFYRLFSEEGIEYDTDPWSNAGYSGIGGGNGTFDFKSDTIALPDLPSIDAVSSGFLQLFTGGLNSILELSRYMWSTNFFDNIVKLTSNPLDIIMGLYMYPFTVPATNQKYIRAGNVITNISMGVPDSQILEIDCGELPIPNFYGAYLDYEPFTKCDLFLPYCGTFPLSMDDIAGKTINVRYRIDLLTGVCGAYVIVDGTVKYNYTGTCAINIPISSRSFENVYNAIMGVVGSMHGGSSFGLPSVGSIAGTVTSGKNQIQHGGNCSGNAGYLGVQKPYLIFSVPNVAIPKGLNKYTGYPIFATYKLADLKGYTEIEQVHLENMGQATKEEIDKIISMLEGGVIL